MSIVTKHGDKGDTGLLYGGRVPKNHPRVETYGTVDEAVSALGLARALSTSSRVKEVLLAVQKELFTLGAELATDVKEYDKFDSHFSRITAEQVEQLERSVKEIEEEISMPPTFIVPGATAASAALDLGRTGTVGVPDRGPAGGPGFDRTARHRHGSDHRRRPGDALDAAAVLNATMRQ